jgi:LCP family protein required for cell wall assembly
MGKHRDELKRPEVVRAFVAIAVVVGVAVLGFLAASGVRAYQAYHSVEREEFASASEVRSKIAGRTPEQIAAAVAAASLDFQPPLLDKDLLTLVVAERNQRQATIVPFELPTATSPALPDGMFASYLLVGQEGPRADAMLFILLPSDGSAPIIASLPRDLYVNNPCIDDYARLNTGLGGCKGVAGGAELLALMVQDYTGIEVDHFARIDFSGFADIINALGGVDICVDNPVRDAKAQLDLPAGCTHVNGDQALAWVRTRHTEEYVDGEWRPVAGASDLTREQHQQEMLFKIADRMASLGSLSAFSSVAGKVASVVHLDSRFAFGDAVSLAWSFRGITASDVRRVHISVKDYVTSAGAWVLLPTNTFNAELAKVYPAAAR